MHPPLLKESVLILFNKSLQLSLVVAQLLLAILTVKTRIGLRRKALGMYTVRDLPSDEQKHGASQKTVRIKSWNKQQRGKHHGKVPVVYSAGGTASVLHKPRLKGTEEQYTYKIAYGIKQAYDNKYAVVDHVKTSQDTYYSVESAPYKCCQRRRVPRLIYGYFSLSYGTVVFLKLLLASHAFKA